jgi:RHS repeat-associated protein
VITRQSACSILCMVALGCAGDRATGSSASAVTEPYQAPPVQREPPVAGLAFTPPAVPELTTGPAFQAPAPTWPKASVASVALSSTASFSRVGDIAVRLEDAVNGSAAGSMTVESFDLEAATAAGVEGVLLRVSQPRAFAGRVAGNVADGSDGPRPVRFTIDYNAFRWAYGGNWASRLSLWLVPECALTSPDDPGCQHQKLATLNDATAGTASAVVQVADSVILAASATAGGSGGTYQATSLAPAATWTAGGNAGDFNWSYALRMPPSLGGPVPKVELSYSSSSVDGRMASTNNQASWIGDGFEWQPGTIERRYTGCADDMGAGANNTVKTGDLCWDTDNAVLALPGHAGELLKDATNPNLWHLRNDDATRIERKTGGPNDDDNGEWWVATTPDGTQYWFGGRSGSNATLTVPVFGNHAGDPCHQAAFKDSSCVQGYRWMLDYVVDPLGNTMLLSYTKETNKYGKNNTASAATVYDRDGYLRKIEYGTRAGATGNAPMQVVFDVADRCLSGCTTRDAQHWPDVPWDRACTAATCLASQISPSFWTTKRLSSIKTQVWNGTAYRDVESWTLSHSFPTSDQPTLWLGRISHRGLVGGTEAVPDITFAGVVMPNRVDTNNDQYPAMNRYRMKTINSETGGKLDIGYSSADCVRGSRVPDQNALQNNALRCYPVKWIPDGKTTPINDFFHKYLVTDVVEADLSGSSTRVITHYDYLGPPAWHYTDDDGLINKDSKTWSVWRGYGAVRTITGDPGEQTSEERRYFRGMHGDKLPSGTRSITLPAIAAGNVPEIADEDAFSGLVREAITFAGPGGAEVSATVTEPWQSAPTATRTIQGSTVHARHVETAVAHTRRTLDGSRGFQTTSTVTTYDANGLPITVDDRGDDAVSGDEKCTLTDYVRNTDAWLLDRRARERQYAVSCARAQGTGLTEDDVIDDTRWSYDGLPWNTAPTKGNLTREEELLAYRGGSPTFQTKNTYVYDAYGRRLESTDVRGNRTVMTYEPASGAPPTTTTETTQLGWVTTITLEPAWNVPLSTTDANGRRVDFAYDPMGRLTSVWLPGRDRATSSPSIKYSYLVRNNAPAVVTMQRLNSAGGYITTFRFYDNLMRDRQTQAQDEAGGPSAVVTDHYYDSAGREAKVHDSYLAVSATLQPVPPSTTLFVPTQNIPRFGVKQYDGAGREIAVIAKVDGPPASPGGVEQWRTTTAYGGDRVDVTPPAGGTPTSKISDVHGNTIELRQYQPGHAAGSPGGFDRTRFEYNAKNKLSAITDSAGNRWEYRYDLDGHKVQDIDPDKGTTTTTYTAYGDVETSTDGRGVAIAYTYDAIGRKLTLRDGSPSGPKRLEWVYDTMTNGTLAKGHLVKTIRYDGDDQYIKEHVGYNASYSPTGVAYTIPASSRAPGVNGTFTYIYSYHPDNAIASTRLPALGDPDLGVETLTHAYNALGKPAALGSSLGGTLVDAPDASTPGTQYTSLGELAAIHLRNNAGPRVDITRMYDIVTRRLLQIWTTRATSPTSVADVRYAYDPAGNITKISDLIAGDHQCFRSDHLRRISDAWTPATGDCTADPTVAALGGPARYWHHYTYDAIGNRTRLHEYATAAGERDTAYTVQTGHRLAATSMLDDLGATEAAYTYDRAGNTLTRPSPSSGLQTMTWDAEGHVATVEDASGVTSFVYDADGNRLLRKDPTGTTLYLPGQELRYALADGSKRTTRYYAHADQIIAMRTAAGITWLSGDHHDTSQISITSVEQTVSIRRQTPFGSPRGSTDGPAELTRGFVGGTIDNTGLTHLGAREYDPAIGRFISVDPVVDAEDPQQLHGYAYANNSPISAADASGELPHWVHSIAHVVSKPVSYVNDHAGAISAWTGAAALVCSLVPPLEVVAGPLAAVSLATGALDTGKSCASGQWLDCALGAAALVPGGRDLAVGSRGLVKAHRAVVTAADDVEAAMFHAGTRGFKQRIRPLRNDLKRARKVETYYKNALNPFSRVELHHPWPLRLFDGLMTGENLFWDVFSRRSGDDSRTQRVTNRRRPSVSSSSASSGHRSRPVMAF